MFSLASPSGTPHTARGPRSVPWCKQNRRDPHSAKPWSRVARPCGSRAPVALPMAWTWSGSAWSPSRVLHQKTARHYPNGSCLADLLDLLDFTTRAQGPHGVCVRRSTRTQLDSDTTLIGTFCNAFCVNRHDGGLTYAPGTVDGTVSSLVEVARDRGAGGVARLLLSGPDNDSSIDAHCYGSGTGGCVVEPPRSRGMMCVSDELPGYVSHAAFVCRRAPSRSVR